jgi:predicted nucleotidyltransferase
MKEKLISYFIEKYKPLSVILHGSRCNGNAHETSDWDFMFILKEDNPEMRRSIIFDQNCEAKKLIYPLSQDKIENISWYLREGNAEVLFDTDEIAKKLIDEARSYIVFPYEISHGDKNAWAAYMANSINGMKAYKDDPVAFLIKLNDFYKRSIVLWFQICKKWENAPQVYESLKIIKSEDEPMYANLSKIAAFNSSVDEKIVEVENIYKRLFEK